MTGLYITSRSFRERIVMKIDGVFSGGGVKAYAFLGALKSIEKKELQLERVAGTSAGAIIASLIAANYRPGEINQLLMELDLQQFLDPPKLTKLIPFSKWFFLYFQMGIYKGERFERWLFDLLACKGIYTFKDMNEGYLKVIVSDLTLGKLVVIPDDLQGVYDINPAYFPVAKAVRMSAGFPYFFIPSKMPGKDHTKSLIVDGGLLSNFPLWVFENPSGGSRRPVLGIKLSGSVGKNPSKEIGNAFDMFHSLFSTMKLAHDARYISKTKQDNIIFIPVKGVDAVDLNITQKLKKELMNLGEESADSFLKYWPK